LEKIDITSDKVLVLNRSFFPLQVSTVEKAVYLLFKGKAVVMDDNWCSYASWEEYSFMHSGLIERQVRTSTKVYIAPEVIRLLERDLVLNRKIALTRQNVIMRDGACAYCGVTEDLTIDHVIPKSRHKEFHLTSHTTWENVVACCKPCNNFKGNRTPEEVGFTMRVKPRRPASLPVFYRAGKHAWRNYLSGV
jgi:5-methylcytosine-specific restriction endonuclease McrA